MNLKAIKISNSFIDNKKNIFIFLEKKGWPFRKQHQLEFGRNWCKPISEITLTIPENWNSAKDGRVLGV